MFVEVKTETGEVYHFDGIDKVTVFKEEGKDKINNVRLRYVHPVDSGIYDGETGEKIGLGDGILETESTEETIDIENAYISEVRPTDL